MDGFHDNWYGVCDLKERAAHQAKLETRFPGRSKTMAMLLLVCGDLKWREKPMVFQRLRSSRRSPYFPHIYRTWEFSGKIFRCRQLVLLSHTLLDVVL